MCKTQPGRVAGEQKVPSGIFLQEINVELFGTLFAAAVMVAIILCLAQELLDDDE